MTDSEFSCWFGTDVHSCVFDPWAGAVGESTLALFVIAIVYLPIYHKTGDPLLPAVVVILLSGSAIALLPGVVASIAYSMMFFTFAIMLFVFLYRTVL
jgi:hypothetical protein